LPDKPVQAKKSGAKPAARKRPVVKKRVRTANPKKRARVAKASAGARGRTMVRAKARRKKK
jgi:hypothetical protein